MQTYIGDIINNARGDTRNLDDIPTLNYPALLGIPTSHFLRFANWAQQRLQSRISKVYPQAFMNGYSFGTTAGSGAFSVSSYDNLYLNSRIFRVEYSSTGRTEDLYTLTPGNPYHIYRRQGIPCEYYRQDGTVIIAPVPSTSNGIVVITYERALDRLDLRRGRINGTPSGATIDLTHSSGSPDTEAESMFVENAYICVSDAFGTPLLYNGIISSYDSGTDVITLKANVSTYLVSGKSLSDLTDAYVTVGRYTTTHSKLVDDAERYLTEYVSRRIFKRESSSDASDVATELVDIENDIISAYKVADKDIKPIPIVDYTFFEIGYD